MFKDCQCPFVTFLRYLHSQEMEPSHSSISHSSWQDLETTRHSPHICYQNLWPGCSTISSLFVIHLSPEARRAKVLPIGHQVSLNGPGGMGRIILFVGFFLTCRVITMRLSNDWSTLHIHGVGKHLALIFVIFQSGGRLSC